MSDLLLLMRRESVKRKKVRKKTRLCHESAQRESFVLFQRRRWGDMIGWSKRGGNEVEVIRAMIGWL
jgi:hypothetical protein